MQYDLPQDWYKNDQCIERRYEFYAAMKILNTFKIMRNQIEDDFDKSTEVSGVLSKLDDLEKEVLELYGIFDD